MNSVIITGILGQDGSILSQLLSKKYKIIGIVSKSTEEKRIIDFLQKRNNVSVVKADLSIKEEVQNLLQKYTPKIVVNFAGVSDTFNPYENIDRINLLNCKIPQNFLEAISEINKEIFFVQSSSSLMYGRSKERIINEKSQALPLYPYGISKLYSHHLLNEFRNKYNLNVCSAIFFNHESYYRGQNFLSKKVSTTVSKILKGNDAYLNLNSLNSFRDISHAIDFMDGIEIICENKINDDFIFSSATIIKIEEFVRLFFNLYQLDFNKYVKISDNSRTDDFCIIGDNSKLKSIGWKPKHNIESLIKDMVNMELNVSRTI